MKIITKPIFKDLPPLNLYPNDIKEIYNLLKTACESVVIEVKVNEDTFLLETPDEIRDVKTPRNHITELSIIGKFDSFSEIRLYFYEFFIFKSALLRLSANAAEDFAKVGLFTKVEEFLLKRKSKLRSWLIGRPFLNIFFVPIIILSLLILLDKSRNVYYFTALILWVFAYFSTWKLPHYYIYTSQNPTFLAKHKENIIAGLIYSVIAGLIVGLILKLF